MLDKIEKSQPVVHRILTNCLKNDRLSHAILFSGVKSQIKLQTAFALAQTLLCENQGCGECNTCKRIIEGNYADVIYVSGKESSIKKEEVLKIQEQFNKTALESQGKKIYIIDLIENMTVEACNSLLKFLEEPSSDITAILITDNIDKVLPTIVSRCQIITFQPMKKQALFEYAKKEEIDEFDILLLQNYVNDIEELDNIVIDTNYMKAKELFNIMDENSNLLDMFFVKFQIMINSNKEQARNILRYYDQIMLGYLHLIQKKETKAQDFKNLYELLKDADHVKLKLLFLDINEKLNRQFDINLLIDEMFVKIMEVF